MSCQPPASLMQKVLLTTDGTVTDLVSLFAGEPIHITKLEQQVVVGHGPSELALPEPGKLLKRAIFLSGAHEHYLFAESYYVLARLPRSLQQQLEQTSVPIGRLWQQARLEMYREVVHCALEEQPALVKHFSRAANATFFSRTYLVHHGGRPMVIITEKFPRNYFTGDFPRG